MDDSQVPTDDRGRGRTPPASTPNNKRRRNSRSSSRSSRRSLNSGTSSRSSRSRASVVSIERRRKKNLRLETERTRTSGIFQCTFCYATFPGKGNWIRHEKTVHVLTEKWYCAPDGPIDRETRKCFYCHLSLCLCEKPYYSACKKAFSRKCGLLQHLKSAHKALYTSKTLPKSWRRPEPEPEHLRCGFCDKTFSSWADRNEHVAQHFLNGNKMNQWRGDWGLSLEGTRRVTGATLPRDRYNRQKTSPQNEEPEQPRSENAYRYQCTFCLNFFPTANLWSCHEYQNHFAPRNCRPKRTKCGFCPTTFKSWKERERHLARHFGNGKTMSQWEGDWGLTTASMGRLSNATAPQERILLTRSPLNTPLSSGDKHAGITDPVICDIKELQKLWDEKEKTYEEVRQCLPNLSLDQRN